MRRVAALLTAALLLGGGFAWWVPSAEARPDWFCDRKPDHHACTTTTTTTTTTTSSTTSTTVPATTTTTTVPPSGVIWSAGHETVDPFYFTEWTRVSSSGAYTYTRDCTIARTGSCSARATIDGSGGVRFTYQGHNLDGFYPEKPDNLPDDATYSAWFYLPEVVDVSWLNLFQWKYRYDGGGTREMVWITVHDWNGQTEWRPRLTTRWQTDGTWGGASRVLATTTRTLPVGEWFNITSRYVWSSTDGRVTTWLNGDLLWDVSGIPTEGDWPFGHYARNWAVNNYGSLNGTFTLWIDNASVEVP